MTVHTIRQMTALQRANKRWQQRQPQALTATRPRNLNRRRTPAMHRFIQLCNSVENSTLFWKALSAGFVIGSVAYVISHWPKA